MTVHGASIGKTAYTGRGREGHTGCEATEWVSDTSVRCKLGQGVQGSRRAVVTAGEGSGSLTGAWSTDVPGLSVMQGSNRAGTGSASLTVYGSGLGLNMLTVKVHEGHTGCEGTEWSSGTSVRCMVGHGALGNSRFVATAGILPQSRSSACSIDWALLSSTHTSNLPKTGSVILRVHGLGFGQVALTPSGRHGPTACEATTWESDCSILAMASLGAGASLARVLTIGNRVSSSCLSVSYLAPRLNLKHSIANLPTWSSIVIGLSSGVGLEAQSVQDRFGWSSAEATVWISDSSLRSKSPVLHLSSLRYAISAGIILGSVTDALSFNAPEFHRLNSHNIVQKSAELLINVTQLNYAETGSKFPIFAHSVASRVADSSCRSTTWRNDTSVLCLLSAGHGTSKEKVILTVGVLIASLSDSLSIDTSSISSITTHDILVDVSSWQMPLMASFAWIGSGVDLSAAARMHASACEFTSWKSEKAVVCSVPSGLAEAGRSLGVTIAQVASTLSEAFTYLPLRVQRSSPSNILRGLILATLGYNFGGFESSPVAEQGQTASETSRWVSETSVLAKVGFGSGSILSLALTIQGLRSFASKAVSYDVASSFHLSFTNAGSLLTEQGLLRTTSALLGVVDMSVRESLGTTACERTQWLSDSTMIARLSMGLGGSIRAVISAGAARLGTNSRLFSYDLLQASGAVIDPYALNLKPYSKSFRTLLATTATMIGATPAARVGGTSCQGTHWASVHRLTCKHNHASNAMKVVVTVGEGTASLSEQLSFDEPCLSGISVINTPVAGVDSFTLAGLNFWSSQVSATARIGNSICLANPWSSDTSVGCKVPMASQTLQAGVHVSVGMANSATLTRILTYDIGALHPLASNAPASGKVTKSSPSFRFYLSLKIHQNLRQKASLFLFHFLFAFSREGSLSNPSKSVFVASRKYQSTVIHSV